MEYIILRSGNNEESMTRLKDGQVLDIDMDIHKISCENGRLVLCSGGFPVIRTEIIVKGGLMEPNEVMKELSGMTKEEIIEEVVKRGEMIDSLISTLKKVGRLMGKELNGPHGTHLI